MVAVLVFTIMSTAKSHHSALMFLIERESREQFTKLQPKQTFACKENRSICHTGIVPSGPNQWHCGNEYASKPGIKGIICPMLVNLNKRHINNKG